MDRTIFVSIASYRDTRCPQTVLSLWQHAARPQRVFVGLCQQNQRKADPDCILSDKNVPPAFQAWRQHHVRTIRVGHQQARGPTVARFLCSQLYAGEDYFFQIDSHSLFVQNWDAKLVHQMMQLQSLIQKPILSHYCDVYQNYRPDPPDDALITTNRGVAVDESGMPYLLGAEYLPPLHHPRHSIFMSAQMMCTPGSFVHEVPFDPHLEDLFFGEEILLTIRAFTHGYDIFTPNRNIIYHAYTREKEPKYWTDRTIDQTEAQKKVRRLLAMDAPDGASNASELYGNGSKRSVEDFYRWTRIQRPWRNPVVLDTTIFDNHLLYGLPSTVPPPPLPSIAVRVTEKRRHMMGGTTAFIAVLLLLLCIGVAWFRNSRRT